MTLNEEGRELDEKRSVKEPENKYKKKDKRKVKATTSSNIARY